MSEETNSNSDYEPTSAPFGSYQWGQNQREKLQLYEQQSNASYQPPRFHFQSQMMPGFQQTTTTRLVPTNYQERKEHFRMEFLTDWLKQLQESLTQCPQIGTYHFVQRHPTWGIPNLLGSLWRFCRKDKQILDWKAVPFAPVPRCWPEKDLFCLWDSQSKKSHWPWKRTWVL